jgi:hypothetical protein
VRHGHVHVEIVVRHEAVDLNHSSLLAFATVVRQIDA